MAATPKKKTEAALQPDEILLIPLRDLVPSPSNVRKTGGHSIEDLAASIKAEGLLQNLTVIEQKDAKGKHTGKYEVTAGGRRMRALQLLTKQKVLPATYEVHCRVTTQERGVSASLAENTLREAMHPADQFEAFRTMIEGGKSIEETAAAFGVTLLSVKQRLKLANVSPRVLDLFREGKLKLEAVMAYALTDDHVLQEQLYDQLPDHSKNSVYQIKQALTQNEIPSDDEMAKFVGIEAYQAAGGHVRQDLFSERGECWLTDATLLRRLANEKLGKAASKVKKEGWGWVDIKPEMDHADRLQYTELTPEQRDPSPEETAKLEDLNGRLNTIQEQIDDIDWNNDDAEDVENMLLDQQSTLEEEVNQIEEGLDLPISSEQMASAGCVVTIERGRTKILRKLVKPEDRKATRNQESSDDTGSNDAEPALAISNALTLRLIAQKTAALQACMAARPDVALAALTTQLIGEVMDNHRFEHPLTISGRLPGLNKADPRIDESKASQHLQAQVERMTAMIPEELHTNAIGLIKWLIDQGTTVTMQILAVAVAHYIDAGLPSNYYSTTCGNELAPLLNLDMREWWQPDTASFLGSVSKNIAAAAVTEACGEDAASELDKLKKGPAAALAEQKLAGTGWLPEILRVDSQEAA